METKIVSTLKEDVREVTEFERNMVFRMISPNPVSIGINGVEITENKFRIECRKAPYGGDGDIYVVHLQEKTSYSRFFGYLVLPPGATFGFHSHGSRGENELYYVVKGRGVYYMKDGDGNVTDGGISMGDMKVTSGDLQHSVYNPTTQPLVILAKTTYEQNPNKK